MIHKLTIVGLAHQFVRENPSAICETTSKTQHSLFTSTRKKKPIKHFNKKRTGGTCITQPENRDKIRIAYKITTSQKIFLPLGCITSFLHTFFPIMIS